MGGAGTGGYGSLMAVAAPADSMTMGQPMNDDAMPQAVSQQQASWHSFMPTNIRPIRYPKHCI
jgi:hypothetical protein